MEPLKAGPTYRCGQCGNKTRFTVKVTRTVEYYHHQTLGGEMNPEEVEVLREIVDKVVCRICGLTDRIEVM